MIQPQQQNPLENNYNINNNDKCKRVVSDKIINNSPRKKIIKKDRQTKIQTAQGPRDRRMRLSLNIARKFFDLQDMLGFDKASQTVEWLLTKSISSITELSRSFKHQVGTQNSVSSTSKIPMDAFSSDVNLEKGTLNYNNKTSVSKKGKTKVRTIRPLAIAKKLREEARKRARERTKEKMISNLQKRREVAGITDGVGYGCSLVGAGSWIPSSNTFLDLQQNGGIIHGLKIPELKNSSGNPGEVSIW
ncbi:hypothetical protein LIER_07122 [Lithospermum erythrorhizon]|uniref:Uncharacterized protein n=1 Tax=Lithospermum erythrorhizon TaxID=34254 RepID=A0AAV3PBN6_LITER